MYRLVPFFSLLLLLTGLAACGGASPEEDASGDPGEVQVVNITVDSTGYHPDTVTLKAGVPARLVFNRKTESFCAWQVQIPAFDVPPTDLPLNEDHAVAFTPTESGTYTFTCGMGMLKGTVLVES